MRGSGCLTCLVVGLALWSRLLPASSARLSPTLMFTGDVLLAGKAGKAIAKHGPMAPFSKVSRLLRSADLAVGNLECSLSLRGKPVEEKAFTFRGRPEAAAALRAAGLDVVTLANNHSGDYGREALLDTIQACRDAGVIPLGTGKNAEEARRPELVRCGRPALTVALLAYSNMLPTGLYARSTRPGTNPAYPASIKRGVTAARAQADVVVVLFHWGKERSSTPSKTQRRLAYAAADAGADLVVGHHPHVLQGLEVRGDCVIAYSLGNFLFPSRHTKTQETMILAYTPEARDSAKVQLIPCVIEGFTPRLATKKERRALLGRVQTLCAELGTTLSSDGSLVLGAAGPN